MDISVSASLGLRGDFEVLGDKSISHRALLLSALGRGTCRIEGLSTGLDVQSTARCLKQLGVSISIHGPSTIVEGRGFGKFLQPEAPLDCGNSGTTMRLLSGIIAGSRVKATLHGDASLRSRPMGRILDPLRSMGARVEGIRDSRAQEVAPLEFLGDSAQLSGSIHELRVSSAQVKSCLLLAGLWASSPSTVIEPGSSRDHTERMLQAAGAQLDIEGNKVRIEPFEGEGLLMPEGLQIPGDPSSAAFFIAAALLVPNSEITIRRVNANSTRFGFIEVLKRMDADVTIRDVDTVGQSTGGEATATVVARYSPQLKGFEIGTSEIPSLVDEIPILAILGSVAKGESSIRGAGELRVKESDRLAMVAQGLKSMGAEVEELEDGLVLQGGTTFTGANVETAHDHRIAMSFAIAGLIAEGRTTIRGAECADVSYPGFFALLSELSSDS